MLKKCDANCDAKVPHLWLRNNIFYYRVELERVGGKRRYKRISLHTDNFFEAREKLRTMTTDKNWPFDELRRLFNNLIFEQDAKQSDSHGMLTKFQIQKRLSKRNKHEDVADLYLLNGIAENYNFINLSPEDRKLLQQVNDIKPLLEEFLAKLPNTSQSILPKSVSAPSLKISEVLDIMLLKGNNCQAEQKNKRNVLSKILSAIGQTLEDDYCNFHNNKAIEEISRYIVGLEAKGDLKRKYLRYIKELAVCGSNIDPDLYTLRRIIFISK